MDATGARGYNHLTGHKRKIPDIAVSIWNLSKGEIFFSGRVVLYQKWVKEAWDGKYKLDSLDSLISQFTEQGKGKRYDERHRYSLNAVILSKHGTPSKLNKISDLRNDKSFPEKMDIRERVGSYIIQQIRECPEKYLDSDFSFIKEYAGKIIAEKS